MYCRLVNIRPRAPNNAPIETDIVKAALLANCTVPSNYLLLLLIVKCAAVLLSITPNPPFFFP